MSFTTDEKQTLNELLDYTDTKWGVDPNRVLHLGLVLLGERDGCHWGVSEDDVSEKIQSALEDIAVPFETENGPNINQFFIATSEQHLRNSQFSEGRAIGEFLGYPDTAISWYENQNNPSGEFIDFLESETNYQVGEFDTENFLIDYIPAGTAQSIQEAEDRQAQYENALRNSSVNFSRVLSSPQTL